jgi:hypothetical protein
MTNSYRWTDDYVRNAGYPSTLHSRERYLRGSAGISASLLAKGNSRTNSLPDAEHVWSFVISKESARCIRQFGQTQISNQYSSFRIVSRGNCIVTMNELFPLKPRMYQPAPCFENSIPSVLKPTIATPHAGKRLSFVLHANGTFMPTPEIDSPPEWGGMHASDYPEDWGAAIRSCYYQRCHLRLLSAMISKGL